MRNLNQPIFNIQGLKITSIYTVQEFLQVGFEYEWFLTIRCAYTLIGPGEASCLKMGLQLVSFIDDELNFKLEFSNGIILNAPTVNDFQNPQSEKIELIGPENAVFVWLK